MDTFPNLLKPIREHVPLAPFTTWKVGGLARYLAEPTETEAPALMKWAKDHSLPIYF